MKQFVIIMLLSICGLTVADAQTFTERIQRSHARWGTITIHHDAKIDELVNGRSVVLHSATPVDVHSVDTVSRKFAGKVYKTNGYRVQVLAGGNSRVDKTKATKAGSEMKGKFPDESVYVHFYSPRWICRMGNYRTYEEAHQMLRKVQQMGYRQASIVKTKITLKY